MATLASRQKGLSSPRSGSSCLSTSSVSKSSPLTSLSESSSSRNDSSDFQRGFLLNDSIRAKGSRRKSGAQKSTDPLPQKSATTIAAVTATTTTIARAKVSAAVKHKESYIKESEQNPSGARSSEKKDSGWAKGFLTNKKKKKAATTVVAVKANEGSNAGKSNARTLVPIILKEKKLDWTKGFLTNKKENKIKDRTERNFLNNNNDSRMERRRNQKLSPTGDCPKAIRSSDILLSIDVNDNRCSSSRNIAQIIGRANTTDKTTLPKGDKKPLISILSEEIATETVTFLDPLQQLQRESPLDCKERGSKGNEGGATKMLTKKSLITPLMSIVGEDEYREEKPSSVFIKEVSTTRKSNNERSKQAELLGVRRKVRCYDQSKGRRLSTKIIEDENSFHEGTTVSKIVPANSANEEDEKDFETRIRNSGDDSNILRLQQEIERLFARPPILPQHNPRIDPHENGDLQPSLVQFWMPKHRRYAWIYLLKQTQQQRFRHKYKMKNGREKYERDARIRGWFFELFDADYFHPRQRQQEIIIHDYDNNNDLERPLESILRCLEAEEDRRMALEAVLIIQEYFIFRYKEQGPQSSRHSTVANAQAERIRRLMPLLFQVALLSSGNRRTVLVQSAWETAILLSSFCIRDSSRMSPLSSSLSPFSTLPVTFWEQLDSLLHQQLVWQQSKTKVNASKIKMLQEVKTKSAFLKNRNPQQESSNLSVNLLMELDANLETLLAL